MIFEEVTLLSVFTNLQEYWAGFTKIAVGTFQQKAVTWSKAARAFKFCHFMPYMMHLEVTNYWGSRKDFRCVKLKMRRVVQTPGIGIECKEKGLISYISINKIPNNLCIIYSWASLVPKAKRTLCLLIFLWIFYVF